MNSEGRCSRCGGLMLVGGIHTRDSCDYKKSLEVIDDLTLVSMATNYAEFRDLYDFDRAEEAMVNLFGMKWHRVKEKIWQGFDQEEIKWLHDEG